MVGIFGGDALQSLTAATPAEQVHRVKAAYRSHEGAAGPVAELKPAQPKPLRLKANPYEGKEGENLHLWVREVELAMDAALISTEQLRVAFSLSNLGDRAGSAVSIAYSPLPPGELRLLLALALPCL
ncbi:Gag protein [Phytophthora palmivora]|uniref:Gag protein n=1 Tax=Phytophthora palmivora TaxID=4796 RepID=A0A2P4XS38_9STRA|nr:Gag protein [Phytophthora palmivora]